MNVFIILKISLPKYLSELLKVLSIYYIIIISNTHVTIAISNSDYLSSISQLHVKFN